MALFIEYLVFYGFSDNLDYKHMYCNIYSYTAHKILQRKCNLIIVIWMHHNTGKHETRIKFICLMCYYTIIPQKSFFYVKLLSINELFNTWPENELLTGWLIFLLRPFNVTADLNSRMRRNNFRVDNIHSFTGCEWNSSYSSRGRYYSRGFARGE